MGAINSSPGALVLFDIGGVLIRWKDERTFREVARRSRVDYARVVSVMTECREDLQSGRTTPAEFWHRVEEGIGVPLPGGRERLWVGEMARHAVPIAATFRIASQLREQGVPTGVFSNTDPSHVVIFRQKRWFAEFDPWVLSYEAGAAKPSPRAFAWAERVSGRSRKELVLVDDRAANVEAARARGWRAVHYRNTREARRLLAAMLRREPGQ